jgi:hypothetical protein
MGARKLPGGVGKVLGGEGDHAEAEKGEEGQGDARDDVAELGVAGEGQQVKVEVGKGGDREQREDGEHDVDDHRLGPGDGLRTDDVQQGHRQDEQHREGLDPRGAAVGEGGAGVAAERDGDHAGDDGVGGQDQPGDDAGEVAIAKSSHHVLEQTGRRGVAGAELREGVALQQGDPARDQERQPDGRAGNLAGRTEQREDPRADHGADADERRRRTVSVADVEPLTAMAAGEIRTRGSGASAPRTRRR